MVPGKDPKTETPGRKNRIPIRWDNKNMEIENKKLSHESENPRGMAQSGAVFLYHKKVRPVKQKSFAWIALQRRGNMSEKRSDAGGESCPQDSLLFDSRERGEKNGTGVSDKRQLAYCGDAGGGGPS